MFIASIIQGINAALSDTAFKGVPRMKLAGLSEPVTRVNRHGKEQIANYEVDNNGEGIYTGIDDGFNLIAYHTFTSAKFGILKSGKFGDSLGDSSFAANMSLVIFGKRSTLNTTPDMVSLAIHAGFPDSVKSPHFKIVKLTLLSVNSDKRQVFNEEYKDLEYKDFLKPEHFLIKINYTIEAGYNKRCFSICI